jgi:hypothetical protein
MRQHALKAEATREIPPLDIRAVVVPASVDEEARTVEVVWSTGADVLRSDFWSGAKFIERLSLKADHVRMDRLNGGAPVLDAHSAWSVKDQIGVVVTGSAKIVGKEGRATLQFSAREDVEPIWQDVRAGIVRNVSVGYRVHKFEETTARDGKIPVRTATDWEPFEISMVPMGADPRARVRGGAPETNPCVFVRLVRGMTDEDRIRALRLARARTGEEIALR